MNQDIFIRDVNIEFANLESSVKSVPATQAAAETFYKELTKVNTQRGLSNLLSSDQRKEKKAEEAFERYYKKGE